MLYKKIQESYLFYVLELQNLCLIKFIVQKMFVLNLLHIWQIIVKCFIYKTIFIKNKICFRVNTAIKPKGNMNCSIERE